MTDLVEERFPCLRPPLRPTALFGLALRSGSASAQQWWVRSARGQRTLLDSARWLAPADATDQVVVARCTGPTLDVGCGPGRLLVALRDARLPALGRDVAPEAVRLARAAGGIVLHRSVFDPLPGEGRWATALLLDGNVGIGGDPVTLLARLAALLQPAGRPGRLPPPLRQRRRRPVTFDPAVYRGRNVIERAFNRLKNWRALATRYDKHATIYRGGLRVGGQLTVQRREQVLQVLLGGHRRGGRRTQVCAGRSWRRRSVCGVPVRRRWQPFR